MSYANGTLNYNLPQTVGTDKRDWSDTNQAFSDVDAALKAASDGASQAAEDITALTNRVGTAEDDIVGLKAEDISLDGRLDTAEGAISTLQLQVPDVRSDVEDMITAFNEASATSTHAYSEGDYFIYNDVLYKATTSIGIGDTIVPNTNCEATNVTTEVAAINSDLGDIKSDLSMKTVIPTPVSNSYGTSALKYRRLDNLLIVFGTFTIATTFGGWVNLEDLPVDIVDDDGAVGVMAVTSAQATDKTILLYRINNRHVYVQGNTAGTFYVNAVFEIE